MKSLKQSRVEAQQLSKMLKSKEKHKKKISLMQHVRRAERLKESAKQEIEQEKEKAIAALREQVASLSVLIASKVIEKELI